MDGCTQVDGTLCHLEWQFKMYQTHVAQSFTPRGRIFIYVRQRSAAKAATKAAKAAKAAAAARD